MVTPMLLGTALFLYVMEMWARTHPDPAALKAQAAAADSVEWVDRFAVRDSGPTLPEVDRYLGFVAQSGSAGGLIHNYINRGLRLLNHGVWGVSGLTVRVGETDRMQHALSRYIDSLEAHPRASLDPKKVVPAMLMAVEVLESQNIAYDAATKRKIAWARESALALLGGPSTMWQRAKVQEFFIRAGVALVAVKSQASRPSVRPMGDEPPRPQASSQEAPAEEPRIPVRSGRQRPPPKLLFGLP